MSKSCDVMDQGLLTILMANGDSIKKCFKVGVNFMALNIITDDILVGPRRSTIQGTGQNSLQSLSTMEIAL